MAGEKYSEHYQNKENLLPDGEQIPFTTEHSFLLFTSSVLA
jgi:hypothetical protein